MKRAGITLSLAAVALLTASASAQTWRGGFHFGEGFHHHHSYFGFGMGWDPWYAGPVYRDRVYRNPFTADVTYVERTSNDFRAAYERLKGDPLGLKAEIQRLDEDLEKMRSEAERYGGVTIRGSELMRDATHHADEIDSRIREADTQLHSRWSELSRLLNDLAERYRSREGAR